MVEEKESGHQEENYPQDSTMEFENFDLDVAEIFLTRRQVTVLTMRERGADQGEIADYLDCTRANVSNIERSARDNIEKARATLSFAEILTAPVRVELPTDLPLHEAPDRIYAVCDEADVKVKYGAPDLIRKITTVSTQSAQLGRITENLVVTITADGDVHVLSS